MCLSTGVSSCGTESAAEIDHGRLAHLPGVPPGFSERSSGGCRCWLRSGRAGGISGLVLNAVVLWNTRYLDAAVARLRAEGHDIKDEDVARLSPLKDRHINFLGRYLFNIKASAPGQGLRPFRDPDAAEDDESD
ncbi:transposase [Streptomyces sp. NBC_01310]|nr:transposase [Streptomyces sp. NBC_01310]